MPDVAGHNAASHALASDSCELTFLNLTNMLKPVTAWYQLGLQLIVPPHELDRIEQDFPRVDRRMTEVLNYWWRNCPTERRSWQTIANALRLIGHRNLAESIDPSSRSTLTQRISSGTSGPKVVSDDGKMSPVMPQPPSKWCGWQFFVVMLIIVVAGLWTQLPTPSTTEPTVDVNKEGDLDLTDSVFDKRPDMVKLRHLELPKSSDGDKKSFDVAEEIANSYKKIGGVLLQDSNGNRVGNIYSDNNNKVVDTSVEILKKWLEGSGKRPVTWRILIRVLEECEKVELAKDIRKALLYMYMYNKH